MKKSGRFISLIALLLCVCMIICSEPFQLMSAAVGQNETLSKQYLKEVKMFYGTSESAAKAACEEEGYTFCPTDLNEGAPNYIRSKGSSKSDMRIHIHMGYKTTENPGDAITDLTLLDMKNTHYSELNYQKYLNEHVAEFRNQAAQLVVLVNELKTKLKAGSPNAQIAYDSLNLIYVDENKPHDAEDNGLGYYMTHDKADIPFFEKFIQRGNSMVLGRIADVLCAAASDYEAKGETWVDRSKTSELAYEYAGATSEAKNMYDQEYEDPAKDFIKNIQDFRKTYTEAKKRFDKYGETLGYPELKGMTVANGVQKLAEAGTDCRFPEYSDALKTYALLDAVQYQKAGETVNNDAGLLAEQEDGGNAADTGENAGEDTGDTATVTYSSNMTLAQYIMKLASDETLEDHPSTVYPIIAAMTPAQRAVLGVGGFGALVEGLHQTDDYASKQEKVIKESVQKLQDLGYKDGRVYLWAGVDNSLYNKKVVRTDAKKEAEYAGADLENSLSEAERNNNTTLQQALEIVDIATSAYSALATIVELAVGNLWAVGTNCFTAAGVSLAAGSLGSAAASAVVGALVCALHIINIVTIVVSIAMFIFQILQWAGVFTEVKRVDYSSLPDIVFDARQTDDGTYSVRYNSIKSNVSFKSLFDDDIRLRDWQAENARYGKDDYQLNYENVSDQHAELTAFQGVTDRWVAMYYSKAPAAGEPIEVKPGEEPFVTKGDYHPPEGYRPLSLIVGSTAVNVNDVEVDGRKGTPLYVFFPGESEGRESGEMVSDDGRYVTNVRFSYSENRQDAINRLKKDDYEYIETNLTPYKGYTFLGYKLGSKDNALTDIRISNSTLEKITFGDANYGKMGLDKQGGNEVDTGTGTTPDGLSLFATRMPFAGSPIVGLSVETKRLKQGNGKEPVCLFSGGDAVDVGKMWQDNLCNSGTSDEYQFWTGRDFTSYNIQSKTYPYEFMSQDDPSNGVYIYFQPKEQFKAKDADGNPAQRYISGFSYFMVGDDRTDDNNKKYGYNTEFMQTFAAENGFELLMDGSQPFRVMSDTAGEMSRALHWRDIGGYPVDTYWFDQMHTLYKNYVLEGGDGGIITANMPERAYIAYSRLSRDNEKTIFHTVMYFGVAYTYNPYRAITGVSGLLTSYTETSKQIKNTGMRTPAGTFLACNVSIQGCPITSAGITAGYYNPLTMHFPLYTNYEARQKSNLSWMTHEETEILSRYLLTSGPRSGILPLKEGDVAFSTAEKPGEMVGFVPVCDLRTPGDYGHPLNFALDTTNKGSKYLYLYLKNTAGGREKDTSFTNVYSAKKYVAGVFCGVGSNPEDAITNLYANAERVWKSVAATNKDVPATPMVTEFDEIIPVDLSSDLPWYTLHCNKEVNSLPNGQWVRCNEMNYYRWDGHNYVEFNKHKKTIDQHERDFKCAYIGVVRTDTKRKAAYGMLKYYADSESAPDTLNCGSTKCQLAGGPVNSPEGKYYLYYSNNSGTAAYQAPITGIEISNDIFVNGYNTAFTVKESDRVNSELPQYSQLRMRTDEYKYIHLGYERKDLPYYEQLYIGIGDTKKDAFTDMVGTTKSYASFDVDCNYNSNAKKWVAIGYRRTSVKSNAIRDVFLYMGDNPPEQIRCNGAYMKGKDADGQNTFVAYGDNKGAGVPYKLVKHALKSGSEVISLNEGNAGQGLYLYYTTASFYSDKSEESLVTPITNICFSYGDISPRYATAKDLAAVFERSYYAKKQFNISSYENPIWECVLGVKGSPQNWHPSGEGATRFSLNESVRPGLNGNSWDVSDSRVYMYVDRADSKAETDYHVRQNAKLPEFGYYASESTFGFIKQAGG